MGKGNSCLREVGSLWRMAQWAGFGGWNCHIIIYVKTQVRLMLTDNWYIERF